MLPGRRLGSTATRFLRYLLPLCLIAATLVAGQGLFAVLERTGAPAVAENPVSLNLGAAGVTPTAPVTPAPSAQTPTASPSPSQAAATRSRPAPVPVTSPVAVFNASNVQGLASRTAAFLRDHGVVVATVDNLAQPVSTPTVFYPPGKLAQARTLAALTEITAVEPTPAWLHANGRLVLVVTDDSTTSASAQLAGP